MTAPRATDPSLAATDTGHPVPGVTKIGAVTILIGLLADVAEHGVVTHVHEALIGGFPVGEHAAHLVVFIGMVLVLAGIVAEGARNHGRQDRQDREAS
jgi:hypothetical protein